MHDTEDLSIEQTRTGYWSVRRGAVDVGGAMTRRGAEAERELLRRLSRARDRRTAVRAGAPRGPRAGVLTRN